MMAESSKIFLLRLLSINLSDILQCYFISAASCAGTHKAPH